MPVQLQLLLFLLGTMAHSWCCVGVVRKFFQWLTIKLRSSAVSWATIKIRPCTESIWLPMCDPVILNGLNSGRIHALQKMYFSAQNPSQACAEQINHPGTKSHQSTVRSSMFEYMFHHKSKLSGWFRRPSWTILSIQLCQGDGMIIRDTKSIIWQHVICVESRIPFT